jgi:FAD/FMN-containing dehydrogenase
MSTTQQPLAAPADFRGTLIQPGQAGYDDARALFNGMIDKRPALIARCTDVADVISAVDYARNTGLPLAVRCGGHNGAGLGSVDDGIVLDLGPMRGIRYDTRDQTVRVQGGCRWGDVDHATHAFGRATPSGIISTTGVGGLTLGGGIGHLTRRYGLSIDSLLSADVVLADGRLVRAAEDENEDLFWAIRGGGGNFGVVTSFEFRTHPVHTVAAGPMLWPMEAAADLMRFYDGFIADAPEELNGFFAFLTVPPDPAFPEHLHNVKMCGVIWCFAGDPEQADEVLADARAFAPPALDGVGPVPFPGIQSAFDALYGQAPNGDQWYWRADFVDGLPDEAIAAHVRMGAELPSMQSTMHLYPIDGAVHRVGTEDTAFANRDSRWAQVIVGVDPDPGMASTLRDWTVSYWEATHPYASQGGGAYVNFLMDDGADRVRATYGPNYERLARIKAEYDPANLFRVNQNIAPAS